MPRIDDHLDAVRAHLRRVAPQEVVGAVERGGLLVDIRPVHQRDHDGVIPGALIIDRNVLEWRLDPTSPHRVADVDPEQRVIVFCNEGYASSIAARSLQEIGLEHATDMVGGIQAWIAAGLPIERQSGTQSEI